ncbi:MAG: dihydrofolate reductase [Pseudomonadales bacterium]|nr:dihydrofolate reductase [Pseudomonadales bacterium]
MRIGLIVAVADNGVIGRDNNLPWRLSRDLQYFKKTTLGKPIIMGRKTYESIGKPLPGRTNIIVTRNQEYKQEGCIVCHSLDNAVAVANSEDVEAVMLIGGAQLYKEALAVEPPLVTHLYVTEVHHSVEGDATFPSINKSHWQEVSRERHSADDKNQYDCSFVVYERSN